MQPKTLEEALEIIKQKDASITDITTQRDSFKTKYETIKDEKHALVDKMFTDEDKEGMTESEKRMADALEQERADRKKLEGQIAADAQKRQDDENARVTKELDARITKAAKGDKTVEDKLRANVALLDKMPRQTPDELNAVINAAYNMTGQPNANPLNEISTVNGGGTPPADKPNFADSEKGKEMGSKIFGGNFGKKEGEGDK